VLRVPYLFGHHLRVGIHIFRRISIWISFVCSVIIPEYCRRASHPTFHLHCLCISKATYTKTTACFARRIASSHLDIICMFHTNTPHRLYVQCKYRALFYWQLPLYVQWKDTRAFPDALRAPLSIWIPLACSIIIPGYCRRASHTAFNLHSLCVSNGPDPQNPGVLRAPCCII